MKIESIIRRKNGTRVEMDEAVYHFKPTDADERHLCEVEIKAHIQRFLAIPEGYQPADLSDLSDITQPAPAEPTGEQPVLGTLDGVVEQDGTVTKLEELPRDQLLVLARDMEIEGAEDMTDEQLAAAVRAEPVEPVDEPTEEPTKDEPQKDKAPAELSRDDLAKQYEAKFGKRPHHKLSAERIKQILAEDDE